MDWIAQLNAMMDYIEENLDGQPDPTRMARMADCSFYNFERMFSYIAGQPLGEYIRSRRMTRAAFDLLHSDARVLDVAVKYGYASQDAFSRAFRAFHGVLPSAARCNIMWRTFQPLRWADTAARCAPRPPFLRCRACGTPAGKTARGRRCWRFSSRRADRPGCWALPAAAPRRETWITGWAYA